jgi:hypothetical protein
VLKFLAKFYSIGIVENEKQRDVWFEFYTCRKKIERAKTVWKSHEN